MEQEKRRSFLKHMLAGSAVIAGAAVAAKPVKAKTRKESSEGPEEVLYHESEAFKKYYKSIRS